MRDTLRIDLGFFITGIQGISSPEPPEDQGISSPEPPES